MSMMLLAGGIIFDLIMLKNNNLDRDGRTVRPSHAGKAKP
jgi:hypothetical protein